MGGVRVTHPFTLEIDTDSEEDMMNLIVMKYMMNTTSLRLHTFYSLWNLPGIMK